MSLVCHVTSLSHVSKFSSVTVTSLSRFFRDKSVTVTSLSRFSKIGLSLSLVFHDFIGTSVSLSLVCHCHYIVTRSLYSNDIVSSSLHFLLQSQSLSQVLLSHVITVKSQYLHQTPLTKGVMLSSIIVRKARIE